jgi:hypothetical protein
VGPDELLSGLDVSPYDMSTSVVSLHRDIRGRVFFPVQLAVVLSPRADQAADGFQGGEFLFCDVPEGRKARRRKVAAGLGDAVPFCTRDRLVPIGGAYGLQPVKHGMAP